MAGLFDMFGGMQNFMGQFNNFRNGLQQQGLDPRQAACSKGQELLDSGKITQDQYNQILNLAKNIRGFMN